jgi:hypothetical protein
VTSSREDMIAIELVAQEPSWSCGFYQVFMKLVGRVVILEEVLLLRAEVNKNRRARLDRPRLNLSPMPCRLQLALWRPPSANQKTRAPISLSHIT